MQVDMACSRLLHWSPHILLRPTNAVPTVLHIERLRVGRPPTLHILAGIVFPGVSGHAIAMVAIQ